MKRLAIAWAAATLIAAPVSADQKYPSIADNPSLADKLGQIAMETSCRRIGIYSGIIADAKNRGAPEGFHLQDKVLSDMHQLIDLSEDDLRATVAFIYHHDFHGMSSDAIAISIAHACEKTTEGK
jgi:hypothetical protein